jgi:hypothetical protein
VTGNAYHSRQETNNNNNNNMRSITHGATVVAGLCAAFGAQRDLGRLLHQCRVLRSVGFSG